MKARFLFVIALICHLATQGQIITTIAGGGTVQPGDGGFATDCKLKGPTDVVTDAAGNIYFCERDAARVRKIAPDGTITTIAGTGVVGHTGDGGPATDAQLYRPYSIAIDAAGNIYFGVASHCIRKVTPSGIITTIAGTGTTGYNGDEIPATDAQLNGPSGIAIDAAGNIYVAEIDGKRVRKIDNTGIIHTVAGTGISIFNGDNIPATSANLYGPIWVAVDNSMNIYISDFKDQRVRKVNALGTISTICGTGILGFSGDNGPATGAQLNYPTGIHVNQDGVIFISDLYNKRVRMIATTGIISTVAGNGLSGNDGDGGPATNAKITALGITLDNTGRLLICDNTAPYSSIRRISNVVAIKDINYANIQVHKLEVYPNPTNGIFSVQTPLAISLVNVYNIGGMLVHEQTCIGTETQVDITTQPPGAYMVYVRCGDKMYVSKVVKN